MVNVTEVRPGNAYSWEGEIYSCIDIDLNKTAMAKMKVKIKSKNVGIIAHRGLSGIECESCRCECWKNWECEKLHIYYWIQ